MIFELGIAGSTSIHEKNYHKVVLCRSIEIEELLFGISIFCVHPALLALQRVYVLS